jgi:hypothetical protein
LCNNYNGNFELAFQVYNNDLRPFIEEVQEAAESMLEVLLPRTEEAISKGLSEGFGFQYLLIKVLLLKTKRQSQTKERQPITVVLAKVAA